MLVCFAGFLPYGASAQAHGADWEVRMVGQGAGGATT